MEFHRLVPRFRIDKPAKFKLADFDPADCCGLSIEKDEAKAMLADGIKRMSELQKRLYAGGQWSVLIVLQAMDAAGKDSLIQHVMSGLNPQGVEVTSFKAPSEEELSHDFLWRIAKRLPMQGRIGILNRSHYEEVLTVRVHRELLARQKLPPEHAGKNIWRERFEDIRGFERYLARNGMLVLKFFLHISREEQRKRFLSRLEEPDKLWKFSMGDIAERAHWNKYMAAYEEAIRETSTPDAPWHVVPADNKWFARLTVAAAIVKAMDGLKLEYPRVSEEATKELKKVRKALEEEAKLTKRRG